MRFFAAAVALLFVALPRPTTAAYLETLGLGSRAIALGNAFVAVADDPSANYYNPAGLTQLIGGPGSDFSIGTSLVGIRLQYTETVVDTVSRVAPGHSVHMDHDFPDWIPQPFLPSGFELGEHVYLSPFGIQSPFAGTSQWPKDFGDSRFSASEAGQIFITWSPTVAYKANEWLSLGVGFDLVIAEDIWQRAVFGDGALGHSISKSLFGSSEGPLTPILTTSNGNDDGYTLLRARQRFPLGISPVNDVDLDFQSPGFRLGVLLFPNEWLRIGAAYRSKLDPEVQGSIETHWEDAILEHPIYKAVGIQDDRDHFRLEFPLPQRVSFGASVQINDQWMVTAEYDWVDWADARTLDRIRIVSGGLTPNLLSPEGIQEIRIQRGPQNTHAGRVGVEWKALEDLALMAGFWWDPTATRTEFYEFGSDPGDRLVFSGGLRMIDLWDGAVDVSTHFQYAQYLTRHVAVGESQLAGGARNIGIPDEAGISLGNFGPNETFAFETGGHVLNTGFLVTIHR